MSDLESFGLILRYWRERAGVSRQKLADAVGAHHNSIQKLETGERKLTLEWVERLAPHINVDVGAFLSLIPQTVGDGGKLLNYQQFKKEADELIDRRNRPPEYSDNINDLSDTQPADITDISGIVEISGIEYAAIGRYDARFSAGPGSIIETNPEPLGLLLAEAQWLRKISQTSPQNLAVVRVDGDSMSNTLLDGDWVLVDRTQRQISREGIYCLQVYESAWIKRISLNLREKLVRVISDNPTIPMQEISEEGLTVFGRVIGLVARAIP